MEQATPPLRHRTPCLEHPALAMGSAYTRQSEVVAPCSSPPPPHSNAMGVRKLSRNLTALPSAPPCLALPPHWAVPGVLREIHYYKKPSEIEQQKPFTGRIVIYDDTVIRYTGRSKSPPPPLATDNLLENTDGVLRPPRPIPSYLLSRGGSLLPSIYADGWWLF